MFKKAPTKELTQQEVEEQYIASSSDVNLTNESLQIAKIECQLQNWGLSKLDAKVIYAHNTFNFKENLCVKIVERKIPVYGKMDSIQLFPKENIIKHRKEFEFLHIGAVQIVLRPMFRLGLGTHVLTFLRDKRHKDFTNFLLGIIDSNLADGPAYFNCYPNFTMALDDMHFFTVLTLDITS